MGSYYYLAAQLPYLVYGQTPPMSSAAFRDLAKPLLHSGDSALLDLVDMDPSGKPALNREGGSEDSGPSYADNAPSSGCDFIDRWREWERSLRLNLARQRAQKTKRETSAPVEPPLFPADAVTAAAKAAASAESPLEAELLLDKARWDAIEGLQGIDNFDRNIVYAYLLKLILLERHQAFKVEEGFAEYKSLYTSILGSVQAPSPVGEIK